MIELGGNIKLIGFKDLEPAKLVVVKKVVGNYAKTFSEKVGDIKELSVELKGTEVKAKLEYKDKTINSETTDQNMFFALDKALSQLKQQL